MGEQGYTVGQHTSQRPLLMVGRETPLYLCPGNRTLGAAPGAAHGTLL